MSFYSEHPEHPAWMKVAAQEGNFIKLWRHAMTANRQSAWAFVSHALAQSLTRIPPTTQFYRERLEMFNLALSYANNCTRPSHRDY